MPDWSFSESLDMWTCFSMIWAPGCEGCEGKVVWRSSSVIPQPSYPSIQSDLGWPQLWSKHVNMKMLQRWSCIKTSSSSWKELYEVENRWRSVLPWEFFRNKTSPRGSVFSERLLPRREIHNGSEKWIQQVFNIIQFVNKKKARTCFKSRRRPLTNVKESSC